jgi:phosphoribosylformylglycinamidine cyclo-ligase
LTHITGGGIAANLARVLPTHLHADLRRGTWTPPAVFTTIGDLGNVDRVELEKTLNMGIGMMAIVAPVSVDATLSLLTQRGITAWVTGEIRDRQDGELGDAPAKGGGGGSAQLQGDYTN